MDNQSFELLDLELMKGLKTVREKQVPQEIRKNFKRGVEERILQIGRPSLFSWQMALVPAVVLMAGLALIWFLTRPRAVETVPQPVVPAVIEKASAVQVAEIPKIPQPEVVSPASAGSPTAQTPAISESDLVSEIEALRELGAWTDEDEAEIGISSDQLFEELEILAGEMMQTGDTAGSAAGQVSATV